ncbi:energy transducer TonB [Chryseobacterium indoltheticum]|uniref:Energy transducer TonB n=1 Tax=Chryseobacterium indoltheticum TaxID=254 RepID=A0A381JRI3_9FLAO|nr:energy transducer TonB [Chryseobacterium indoltheticum]AZA62257.1 energy transducer TonB [Chryseobacterium indoltheticum]AZA75696.1 energy transducer TonB [Chryseobacterium indoltheticum]QQQ27542.1 energy transducer TonB [Chryseobacterium indoltheticum]SIQ47972.1 outer membrane transport energization protein TonB [Chryseobacterium indoltheticum]SUY53831.1 Gram-negative bacterial tonB protein [Chryseobacterium indoltheticum]
MADENIYNQNLTLDEIVFENRNKEYGAYDLRHQYPRLLTKSFLIGTGLFLVTALSPFIYMTIKSMNEKEAVEVKSDLVEIIEEDPIIEQPKEEEPPPPPPPVEEEKIEIIQNVVPEPVKAPKVETPPPPISKQLETTTGLVAQEGVKAPAYTPPPPPPSTGNKTSTAEVKPQVSETQVYNEVEQTAEFPGGINAFRKKVGENFDSSAIEGADGVVKGEVTFVVERDGSITDIKVTGKNSDFNSEAVRTVKSIKNKWAPAKINGKAVRYRYRLPLAMQPPE